MCVCVGGGSNYADMNDRGVLELVCVLPMKEPVLQMRLKKQLSGGRAPHLLRETRQRQKSCECFT